MKRRTRTSLFFLLVGALTLACAPTFAPAFTPIPTFDPNVVYTAIQQTGEAAAAQTQAFITPTLTPTETPTPTRTPSETPSPTVTFIFILNSPTPSKTPPPGGARTATYSCKLISQTPADNSVMGAGTNFSVRWQVQNTGSLAWYDTDTDYHYLSGAQMYVREGYDLSKSIPSGELADITADMVAPPKPGKYQTVWILQAGKTEFCKLTLTIISQ